MGMKVHGEAECSCHLILCSHIYKSAWGHVMKWNPYPTHERVNSWPHSRTIGLVTHSSDSALSLVAGLPRYQPLRQKRPSPPVPNSLQPWAEFYYTGPSQNSLSCGSCEAEESSVLTNRLLWKEGRSGLVDFFCYNSLFLFLFMLFAMWFRRLATHCPPASAYRALQPQPCRTKLHCPPVYPSLLSHSPVWFFDFVSSKPHFSTSRVFTEWEKKKKSILIP